MKKLFTVLLLAIISFAYSQNIILDEDFEGGVLPNTWVATQGDANSGWQVSEDGSGGNFNLMPHTQYAFINDSDNGGDMSDVRLISPELDFSSNQAIILSFATFYALYGEEELTIQASTDSGNNWNIVGYLSTSGQWSWLDLSIDISSLAGESSVLLSFHYNDFGYDAYGWAIDDVMIYQPNEKDVIACDVFPPYCVSNKDFTPSVKVKNNGSNVPEELTCVFNLLDSNNEIIQSASQTFTNINIEYMKDSILILDTPWNIDEIDEDYKIECTVQYEGDENIENNSISKNLECLELSYDNLPENGAYVMSSTKFMVFNDDNNEFNTINDFQNTIYPSSLEFIDGVLYANISDFSNYPEVEENLAIIDGDGSIYNIGVFQNNYFINAISWNPSNNTTYCADGFSWWTDFYSFDKNSAEMKFINTTDEEPGQIIGMDFMEDGTLIGISLLNNSFYKFDIEDLTNVTLLEPTGLNFGSGNVDISYNDLNGKFYFAATNDNYEHFLCSYDYKGSGSIDNIIQLEDQYVCCIAFPNDVISNTENYEDVAFSVYPNPANEYIMIQAKEKCSMELLSLDGRSLITKQLLKGENNINIASVKPGTYIIKLTEGNNVLSEKILIF